MSAISALQPGIEAQRSINCRLANGSLLTYTEVPDENFALRYEVKLDGNHLGLLALWFIEPFTEEQVWISSADDCYWSPPFSNQQEAMRFLMPLEAAC